MKKIKIFAVPSHVQKNRTGGVDYYRVIQPMKALNGYEYKDYKFEVDVFDLALDEHKTLFKAVKDHDIIFFNYTTNAWGFAAMGAFARMMGKLLVMDMDDNLWNVQNDNPVYNSYKKGSEGLNNFTAIVNEVDYITTTSQYLKHAINHNSKKYPDRIFVCPNFVDMDTIYTHRNKFKDNNQIQLIHHGSTTHFIDLQNREFEKGMDMVMKRYPNVTFKTIGAFVPKYRQMWGQRYVNAFGDQDYYKWSKEVFPRYMDESDIVVVPLDDNIYTRCKSNVKYLESSTALIPGVWQDIRQYQETVTNGKDGYLAETAQEWFDSMSDLIDHPTKRKEMAKAAFKTVKDNWQMKNNLDVYADFLVKIFERHLTAEK